MVIIIIIPGERINYVTDVCERIFFILIYE